MSTVYKKLLDQLRIDGAEDAKNGKPIGAFFERPYKRHTEQMRGVYEIGWRAEAAEQRKRARQEAKQA